METMRILSLFLIFSSLSISCGDDNASSIIDSAADMDASPDEDTEIDTGTETSDGYGGSLREHYQVLEENVTSGSWSGFDTDRIVTIFFDGELINVSDSSFYAVPNSVFLADIDNDGLLDIVVDNELYQNQSSSLVLTETAYFIRNIGDGSFSDIIPFVKGSNNEHISDIADVTKNGFPDIIAYSFWGNDVIVYEGLGNMEFASPVSHSTGTNGGEAYAVDANRDGRRDLVAVSSGSGVGLRYHLFANYAERNGNDHEMVDLDLCSIHNHFVPVRIEHRYLVSYVCYERLEVLEDDGTNQFVSLLGITALSNAVFEDVESANILGMYVPFPQFFLRNGELVLGVFSGNRVFLSSLTNDIGVFGNHLHGILFDFPPSLRLRDINADGRIDIIGAVQDVVEVSGVVRLHKTDKIVYRLANDLGEYTDEIVEIDSFEDDDYNPARVDQYSGIALGDINGDGFEDLIVLLSSYDNTRGAIKVYFAN